MVVALVAVLLCLRGKSEDEIQAGSGAVLLRRTQPAARNDTTRLTMVLSMNMMWRESLADTFPCSLSFAPESQRF
jgi:hypothetical protein